MQQVVGDVPGKKSGEGKQSAKLPTDPSTGSKYEGGRHLDERVDLVVDEEVDKVVHEQVDKVVDEEVDKVVHEQVDMEVDEEVETDPSSTCREGTKLKT